MGDDYDVTLDGLTIGVRELGAPDGAPVLHFHGTPGSRLELAFADDELRRRDVRLIAFDRPGCGRSTATPFTLSRVAQLAVELLNTVGIDRCPTLGWSGGGPFALATAATAPDRVTAVGVMAGAAPFQQVPGALAALTSDDAEAASHLPDDPATAAEIFRSGFSVLGNLATTDDVLAAFGDLFSERDKRAASLPRIADSFLADLHESSVQQFACAAWDNVAWIGEWDVDLDAVRCPVRLWYGDDDRMARLEHATWLADHLAHATLTIRPGYGHLLPFEHLLDMVDELLHAAEVAHTR